MNIYFIRQDSYYNNDLNTGGVFKNKFEFYPKSKLFLAFRNSIFDQIKTLVGHCMKNYIENKQKKFDSGQISYTFCKTITR